MSDDGAIGAVAESGSPPLITIVLPTYNGERYLAESLQSCIEQTYQQWELIVVDDASTDTTPAIIGAFAARDARIRHIRHETNRRLPGALNTGFAAARGELLTWTSDDNRFRPAALERLTRALLDAPDVDFVYADYDIINDAGRYVRPVSVPASLEQLLHMEDALPCFLYRQRVFERVGPYAEDLFLAEDYDYFLRVAVAGLCMRPLHENLYEYRRHASSLSDEHHGRAFLAAERALRRHLPLLDRMPAAVRGEARLHLASLAAWQLRYGDAFRAALAAARFVPLRAVGQMTGFTTRRLARMVGWRSHHTRARYT